MNFVERLLLFTILSIILENVGGIIDFQKSVPIDIILVKIKVV